jgi:diacylglycerol kinase family enzyme
MLNLNNSMLMSQKIAFLINPLKKTVAIANYFSWVMQTVKVEKTDWEIQLFINEWPSELGDFDQVWVMGGDGTFNYFVNKYPSLDKPIALFKGGTGNDFYWKLFGERSRREHLDAILAGHSESFDAGSCNGQLFLNGVGIGIEGDVLKSMDSIRYFKGGLGYYLAAIPNLLKFKTYQIQGNREVFLCMVFNSSRAGGGFHFFPKASVQDGLLDVLFCDPIPVWKRLYYMPIIQSGKHVNLPIVEFSQTKNMSIKTSRILSAQVDGEVQTSNQFDFQVLPAKFKFIIPQL